MNCEHCGRNLTADEMRGESCRYCGTVLPHRARAMEKAAVVKEILADADGDGIPDIMQQLGSAGGGAQVLSSGVVVTSSTTTTATVTSGGSVRQLSDEEANRMLAEFGFSGPVGASNTIGVGSAVLVTWADGNRYPGQVVGVREGEFEVRFGDGRVLWVGATYVARS